MLLEMTASLLCKASSSFLWKSIHMRLPSSAQQADPSPLTVEEGKRYTASQLSAGEQRGAYKCRCLHVAKSHWGTWHTDWWTHIVSASIPTKSICPVGKAHWDLRGNNIVNITMREEAHPGTDGKQEHVGECWGLLERSVAFQAQQFLGKASKKNWSHCLLHPQAKFSGVEDESGWLGFLQHHQVEGPVWL